MLTKLLIARGNVSIEKWTKTDNIDHFEILNEAEHYLFEDVGEMVGQTKLLGFFRFGSLDKEEALRCWRRQKNARNFNPAYDRLHRLDFCSIPK